MHLPVCMTSLDLPSEHPLPADSQVDAEGFGVHSGEEEDEQSAAAALLGMAAGPFFAPSQNSPGSAKRELFEDPRQLLSDSRGSSSDDLSSIYSNGGGAVKRQRSETKDHGGAHTSFPALRAARASASCPRLLSSSTTRAQDPPPPPPPPPRPPAPTINLPGALAWPPAFGVGPNLSRTLTLARRAAARHMPVPVQVSSMHEDVWSSWLITASTL